MDDHYWMYIYKVAKCPAKERHDWSSCPYAHKGERAARRCPRTCSYSAEPCPDYSKRGTCLQGEACPMAHSVFESWLHPSRFRTQLCCFGSSCRRRICFFAHSTTQLRMPVGSGTPAAANPTAPVLRRTQAVVPAAAMGMPAEGMVAAAAPAGPSAASSSAAAAAVAAAAAAAAAGGSGMMLAAAPQTYSTGLMQTAGAGPGVAVPMGVPVQLPNAGWVLTSQGWAPGYVDQSIGMITAPGERTSSAVAAAAAAAALQPGTGTLGSGEMASLTAGLDGLMLGQGHLVATSQSQAGMPETYLAAGPGMAGSKAATDQLNSDLCLPVSAAAGMFPGYQQEQGGQQMQQYYQPSQYQQGWQ